MTRPGGPDDILPPLDAQTRALVRLAATIAVADEAGLREAMAHAAAHVPAAWVEELLLQSYLFAGFPRALNATREWRRASGRAAPHADEGTDYARHDAWRARGEDTCAVVYGASYARLRDNIRALHPALDAWMVVEGYGKVLARPALDLLRRELCIVATCAVARQDRQLHAHLQGALNAGAAPALLVGTLDAVRELLTSDDVRRHDALLARVLGK